MATLPTRRPPTILLVDDSVSDLRILMELMASRKFRVVVAFDGKDGYHKAILNQPDLIVLDVRMPEMDGFATCRMLKADPKTRDIPVIFLTAANDVDERLAGLTMGGVDYIVKPFASETEVLARIDIHLEIARRLGGDEPAPAAPWGDAVPDAPGRDQVLVKAATAYLLEHIASPPSHEELARIMATNEKRLNDAFRNVLLMPVFTWLREERMKRARHLLVNTDTPIRDIGGHVGYPNPANFATAFKERFGFSPRECRSRMRNGQPDEAEHSDAMDLE